MVVNETYTLDPFYSLISRSLKLREGKVWAGQGKAISTTHVQMPSLEADVVERHLSCQGTFASYHKENGTLVTYVYQQ